MNTATERYKDFIDGLVKMSHHCAAANAVQKGRIPGTDAEASGINELLARLSSRERDVLAKFVGEAYHSGIYDTLEQLEWLRCCKGMAVTVEGNALPLGEYEGLPCDYIGRRSGWGWPDE